MASEFPHEDSPLVAVAVGLALVTTFALAGVLFALGVEAWWFAFVLTGGAVPLAAGLARWYEERDEESPDDESADESGDALEQLRARYARGEIDEAEFEHRLERLLETEDRASASEALRDRRETGGGDREGERDRGREREEA
ncbi:SHOCT domain-containing protein [Halomicrobium salinisoli]|uniref:SHOCT domain-containing protein n=1 Tax=Halomicrobium salinisoli TaxID=2878391 RepID=UPI001CEFBECC|nr:SHOCT domain-containing protein [Halomicrobium salinisoli]